MLIRLFATTAAAAVIGGAAFAQTPAQAPAAPATPAPAAAAPAAPAPAATAPATAPAASTAPRVTAAGDLIATAKASGQFTTLVKALDATNLTGVLQRTPNLTVFAPTDAAFAALPAGQLDELMKPANAATLQKILTYHVINAPVPASKIKGAKGEVKTVEGDGVMLDGSGDNLMVDAATIVQSDVMATNGILHVVDKVLMPGDVPGAQAAAATDTTASAAASAVAPTGQPQSTAPVNTAPTGAAPVAATPGAPPASPPVDRSAPPAAAPAPGATAPPVNTTPR